MSGLWESNITGFLVFFNVFGTSGCPNQRSSVPAEHMIRYLHDHIDALPKLDASLKVGIEPGCAAMDLRKEMREVVEAMGCEVVNTSMGCCGKNTTVADPLMDEREAECAGADWIVVGCPMCQVKFDAYPDGIPSMHISELVAMAAGDTESLRHHRIRKD